MNSIVHEISAEKKSKIYASSSQLFPEDTVTSFNSGLIASEQRRRPM